MDKRKQSKRRMQGKKSWFIISVLLILALAAGCSASTANGGQESSSSGSLTETAISKDGAVYGNYENKNGWTTIYEPSKIDINAEDENDVRFVYTGEAAGENYVEIRYIADKQPEEVLTEEVDALVEKWELDPEEVVREEGYIYEDKWAFLATAEYSDDERVVTVSWQSAEYNGGVILTKLVVGMTDENILEGKMDDVLWQVLDRLSFYNYEPQQAFSYVPGTYSCIDEDSEDIIILKEDHSGFLEFKDKVPIIWGSTKFTVENTEDTYEFNIEGKALYLKEGDDSREFRKTAEIDEAVRKNPLKDKDYVKALNKEIDYLYNDASGEQGRIHKMQAFIMELALHAKSRNPDFKVIAQNGVFLAYNNGKIENGEQAYIKDLVDGYGVEGIVGTGKTTQPDIFQQMYVDQAKRGKFVADTTTVRSEEDLKNYLDRANAWGIVPFPKLGGELAMEKLPGKRWADNGDYFWVEDPKVLGVEDRMDGSRDVNKLTDAKNFLYNINSRPYDNWEDWDKEEKEYEKGDGDRIRITDSYASGLLVPSENGPYVPVGEDPEDETIAEAVKEYGDHWDWWWRAEGLNEKDGRKTWLEALRNSEYDVIFIDSFYNHRARPKDQTPLTKEEVESLKKKPDGGRRQVIAYLSIGSAEQNRWYCQDDWIWIDPKNKDSFYSMKCGKVVERATDSFYIPFWETGVTKESGDQTNLPVWLAFGYGDEYPEEAVVEWWHQDWRNIIINGNGKYAHSTTGDNTSSIDRILDQGFDGVYLDNTDSCIDGLWDSFEKYWNNHGGIPVGN